MQFSSRKKLDFGTGGAGDGSDDTVQKWSDGEAEALLEYLLFHEGPGTVWFKKGSSKEFWNSAAQFVQSRSGSEHLKTDMCKAVFHVA